MCEILNDFEKIISMFKRMCKNNLVKTEVETEYLSYTVNLTVQLYDLWDKNDKIIFNPFWNLLLKYCDYNDEMFNFRNDDLRTCIQRNIVIRRKYFNNCKSFSEEKYALVSATIIVMYYFSRKSNEKRKFWLHDSIINHNDETSLASINIKEHKKYGQINLQHNRKRNFNNVLSSSMKEQDVDVFRKDWFEAYNSYKDSQYFDKIKNKMRIPPSFKELSILNDTDLSNFNIKSHTTIKVPIIFYNGKVLKQMKRSVDYGSEQHCVQSLKKDFELNFVDYNRMFWPFEYNNNKRKFVKINGNYAVYFITDEISDNPKKLSKLRPIILKFSNILEELFRILFFRLILGISDTTLSNILINEIESDNPKLWSIDEKYIGCICIDGGELPHNVRTTLNFVKRFPNVTNICNSAFYNIWGDGDKIGEKLQIIKLTLTLYNVSDINIKMSRILRNGKVVKSMVNNLLSDI